MPEKTYYFIVNDCKHPEKKEVDRFETKEGVLVSRHMECTSYGMNFNQQRQALWDKFDELSRTPCLSLAKRKKLLKIYLKLSKKLADEEKRYWDDRMRRLRFSWAL